jgi:hypothetical protein
VAEDELQWSLARGEPFLDLLVIENTRPERETSDKTYLAHQELHYCLNLDAREDDASGKRANHGL